MKKLTLNKGQDYLFYREAQGGVIEIDDIAVTSKRRMGIGTELIKRLEDKLENDTRVYAFTRSSNHMARLFYKKLGFSELEVNKFYKEGNAILLTKRIKK